MSDIDKFHEWVETQSPLALREYMFAQAKWLAMDEEIKQLNQEKDSEVVDLMNVIQKLTAKVKELEEKYQRQYKQWISLRELYNKTIREYDQPEIRLLKAKLYDSNELAK